MSLYLVVAICAAIFAGALTNLLARYAREHKILIAPIRERDTHTTPTPRVGGIAIFTTFVVTILLIQLFRPDLLLFSGQEWLGMDRNLIGILFGGAVIFAVNYLDDARPGGLDWRIRIVVQILAALVIFWFGIKINWLSNPFGGRIILASFEWLFVVIWLVATMNAMNMLDGVDGLAGGVSAITLFVIILLSLALNINQQANAVVACVALGAVLGFLPFNLSKQKVFLGDTGSVFLGLIIGILAIVAGGKIATVFLLLAIPFLDAATVIIWRLAHGLSPFKADRNHLHHKLLAIGFKPWHVTGLFYAVTFVFGYVALNTQTLGKLWAILIAISLMLAFITLYSLVPLIRRTNDARRIHLSRTKK